jgi:hypothetical protein
VEDLVDTVPANRRPLVATIAGWSTHVDFAESGLGGSRLQEIISRRISRKIVHQGPYCDIGSACQALSLNHPDFPLPSPPAHREPAQITGSTHASVNSLVWAR